LIELDQFRSKQHVCQGWVQLL